MRLLFCDNHIATEPGGYASLQCSSKMPSAGVKVIFGAGLFGSRSLISSNDDMDEETGKEFLYVLEKANVKELDTARSYVYPP